MYNFYQHPFFIFLAGLSLLILFFVYFATSKERRKRNVGTLLLTGVCALCVFSVVPPKERLKGGIDILGGSSFTLRIQEKENPEGGKQPLTVAQIEQAITVIEKRLNSMGTAEPFIARQGANRILVQMPGVEPEESLHIRETLEKVAKLELREVHPRSGELSNEGTTLAQQVGEGRQIVPGYRAYRMADKEGSGVAQEWILLSRRAALGGADISSAFPSPEQNDAVGITLNSAGADKMIELTRNMRVGQGRIAIVLDGEVISAPVVQAVPLGKNFSISGLRDPGEPQNLANALMNPLENPLVVEAERTVSASYGSAIIKEGIWAGVVGVGFTFLFVLLYYRVAGLLAVTGLIINGVILFGVMAMFGFTFTLPGIAGMILTIGMAVDANVLIYERLREEIDNGKSVKSAIASAYEKAFSAIFDANITSLVTAVILFWLASGMIKGFAITLTIGLLASMFSAILVTRVFFRWGVDSGALKRLSFMNLIPPTKIDFLRTRKIACMASAVMIAVTFAAFGWKGSQSLGIDFTGGTLLQFQLGNEQVPLDHINDALRDLPLTKEAYPQEEHSPATGSLLTVRCETADAEIITNRLREAIPLLAERTTAEDGRQEEYRIAANKEEVSALIGGTFLVQSLLAVGMGLIGILIYIAVRFEWSFAVGGFVSTIHDVVVTLGIVILAGQELTLIHVGAILTVAGYSLNDTIVIYDRIRESLMLRQGPIKDLINEAINATLSRTILTSSTTIITVVILMIVSQPLRDFSFTILVGLVVGTYSSVFIASPIVLWWTRRAGIDLRAAQTGQVAPVVSPPLLEGSGE